MDSFTSPLQKMTQSLNMTLNAMQSVQEAVNQNVDISNTFDAARQSIAEANAELQNMANDINNAGNQQQNFNQQLEKGTNSADGLLKKITGIVAIYASIQEVKGMYKGAWSAANDRISAEQRLQSIMRNINGMTQDGIDLVKNYADEMEGVTAIAADVGIRGMSQLAEYVYDPNNIKGMTEAMYNLATETYGANVSADQLTQTANLMGKVMMGDINSLARNGFKVDSILTEADKKMLKFGTESQRAAILVDMVNENIDGLARAMANIPEGQILRLNNAWGAVKEQIGLGVMGKVSELTNFLLDNMPQISSAVVGTFNLITEGIGWAIDGVIQLTSFVQNHWDIVQPMLIALATVLLVAVITKLYEMAAAWLAAAWPILLVAAAVASVIYFVMKLGATVEDILGYIGGSFSTIVSFLKNSFAFLWNILISTAEFLENVFKDPVYAIQKLFYNMLKNVTDYFGGLVSGIVDGLNWLIEQANKVPGINISTISDLDTSFVDKFKPEDKSGYADWSKYKMNFDDYSESFQTGSKKMQDFGNGISDIFNNINAKPELVGMMSGGAWNTGDNINLGEIDKVKKVGKIEDKVDISSEDLKTMRDLAEMKSIQNFVTLTPTVSVTTGPVNNGADIDTIIARIEQTLEEEITSSAAGVYT